MKSRTTKTLYSYWNALRGDRLAPARLEVDPGRLVNILSETFILERDRAGTFVFRLAGTRICEQFGYELRGRDFTQMAGPGHTHILDQDLVAITNHGAVGVFELEASALDGRTVVFEAIVMPLQHTQAVISRYLGSISVMGTPPPAWLGSVPLTPQTLRRNELFWPAGGPPAVTEPGHQLPFSTATPASRIVRHERRQFRVFEGGRPAGETAE